MQLKLVCLNLWQGGNLFPEILQFLHQERPDVICFQEAYNNTQPESSGLPPKYRSLEVLRQEFPSFFYHFAPTFLERKPEGLIRSGNLIFSRFPIIETRVVFFDRAYGVRDNEEDTKQFEDTPRNLQLVTLELPKEADKRKLVVGNTQGIWGIDGDDSPRRLAMGQTIATAIETLTDPVVLMGDFNLQPNTQAIGLIEQHLTNVFKAELATSFNMRRKTTPGYATAVVDMVFASSTLEILDHRCPDVDISDHLPLVVKIEV